MSVSTPCPSGQLVFHYQVHALCVIHPVQQTYCLLDICFPQEMVDWFNSIRAARFHYLQVAFPGASDEEVRQMRFIHAVDSACVHITFLTRLNCLFTTVSQQLVFSVKYLSDGL